MSAFVAITFENEDSATRALHAIRSLEKEGQIGLEDTAVAHEGRRRQDPRSKNEVASGTESGAARRRDPRQPPVRRVPGRRDRRRGDRRRPDRPRRSTPRHRRQVRQGGRGEPGRPAARAIFLLTKGGNPGLLIARDAPATRATVVQTTLDDEEEQALRDSLK